MKKWLKQKTVADKKCVIQRCVQTELGNKGPQYCASGFVYVLKQTYPEKHVEKEK